jgi:ABC-type sugar transport system ATPase subunit
MQLATHHLAARYGDHWALRDASLTVMPGRVHALVGENGAGKSTLIKCLAGLLRPARGQILIDGAPVTIAGPRAAEARGLRFIHQELSQVPYFDVVENTYLGRRYPRKGVWIDRRAMVETVRQAATLIAPDLALGTPVARLSAGERQLGEIVRAFMGQARVLVMDEPTAALGTRETGRLFEVITRLTAAGVAVIFISHRLEDVFAIADDITVLREGKSCGSFAANQLDRARLIALMSGRQSTPKAPPRPARPDAPVTLAINEVVLRPGASVSLSVRRGEIIGLYGLLGSGRSRLLKTLFGAPGFALKGPADIRLGGAVFQPTSPAQAIRAGLALVPEERRSQGLFPDLSLVENLSIAHLPAFRHWRWLAMPDRAAERAHFHTIAKTLALVFRSPDQPIRQLSGGNQQKLMIGRWLRRPPRLLLLDEPTRGVDIAARRDIYTEIRKLAGGGAAVLFASSDLDEIRELANRVVVMRDGGAVADFARDAFSTMDILEACYGRT